MTAVINKGDRPPSTVSTLGPSNAQGHAVHTPEWWRDKLDAELDARRPTIDIFDAYYRGEHPLPTMPERAKDKFRKFQKQSRSNWMGLVVDAVAERLKVEGFRYGADEQGDKQAWRIWQANGLDIGSESVHLEALIAGESAVTVEPNPDDQRIPLIVPEHPTQVIVAKDPARYRARPAAWKKWQDDSGYLFGVLYMPDRIYRYRSATKPSASGSKVTWEPRVIDENGEEVESDYANPLGEVPVVPFCNAARMMYGGVSEIADVTDIQDRINKTLFDRMMAQEFSAFRQRWVTGLEIPNDDNGQPVEPFQAAVDRVWFSEDPNTKFGEFEESTLAGYIAAIESDVQHLAAITRTPPHYLLGQSGVMPSGESLKSTETGLVAKAQRRQVYFGESWEDVMRLAFKAGGFAAKARRTDGETIWRNPESRTLGELTDALVKLKAMGVPDQALWVEWGASPQKVEQWLAIAAKQGASSPSPLDPTAGMPGAPAAS